MSDALLDRFDLCGPYKITHQRLTELRADCIAREIPLIDFTPTHAVDRNDWLKQLGISLNFPAQFGNNFDALYDCLCDPDVLSQPILAIVFDDLGALGGEGTDTLIAVLQAAADEWREQERALWTLFATPGIDLDQLPSGVTR